MPRRDTVHHDSLRQVHGVGDGQDDQLRCGPGRPLEQVVENGLLPVPEHVELIHEQDRRLVADLALAAAVALAGEELVEQVGGVVGGDLLLVPVQLLPDLDVGLVRLGQLHPVDVDELEILDVPIGDEFLQRLLDLHDRGRLAGAGDAADVHAAARTLRDLSLREGQNFREFVLPEKC